MIPFLYLHARLFLWLGGRELARSYRYDRRSAAALIRAEAWMAEARAVADRLERARRLRSTFPANFVRLEALADRGRE